MGTLVLTRKKNEKIVLGDGVISIVVVDIRGDKVRIGINAPANMAVHRQEVYDAIKRNGENLLTEPPSGP